jgi:Rad3-related DNA helicase
VRTVVQMCGRAVRNEDDWAKTWVLDSNFEGFWAKYGHLFPGGRGGWWSKGLKWER